MDIKERNDINAKRHPWEISRLLAVQKIISEHSFEGMKVLDLGCGDGFVARGLFKFLKEKQVTAVDINLTNEIIQELNRMSEGIIYLKTLPEEGIFDIILLLDVIEHIEDDKEFLVNLVNRYISYGGKVLITVPAFQSLYSCHDTFLGHCQRYTLGGLKSVVEASGLKIISSGYLFLSLLIPKFILYRIFHLNNGSDGVGSWSKGKYVTYLIEKFLNIDNFLLMSAGRLKIKLPGLTVWVLCEKPR